MSKIDCNLRINQTHHRFKLNWIKIFLQILIWVNFWSNPSIILVYILFYAMTEISDLAWIDTRMYICIWFNVYVHDCLGQHCLVYIRKNFFLYGLRHLISGTFIYFYFLSIKKWIVLYKAVSDYFQLKLVFLYNSDIRLTI